MRAAAVPIVGQLFACLPAAAVVCKNPCPLWPHDYCHLFAYKSLAGMEGHGPVPTRGRPWPGFTNAHHHTHKHTDRAACVQVRCRDLPPREMAGHGLRPCSTRVSGQQAPGATHGGQCPGGEASAVEPQNGILGPPALGLDHSPRQKPNNSDKHC